MLSRKNRNNTACSTKPALTAPLERGFTLVELMVVVAIVGILSAIALPAYSDYVLRGKIPDAISSLAAKRVALEQFYQDNKTYVKSVAGSVHPCDADTSSKNFTVSCTAVDVNSYTLQALGQGSMVAFTFTVDQSNLKKTVAVPSGWALPDPNTCWVTNKGGKC
jgi:type IV pilus assembly protein PilE